ncbi:MAG TPA: FliH/SctL family protein [Thermoguttaceae bacterium]|nr:FliH/SctL family protein [Thermoguttaceae bacterium]
MIIKATHPDAGRSEAIACLSAVELAELTAQSEPRDGGLRGEAARLVAAATHEAERIRREAAEQGFREGQQAAREELAGRHDEQWSTLRPALDSVVGELRDARHAWLEHWEKTAVRLAVAIARRILRRELTREPAVSLALVREALDLAAGNDQVRVLLSPDDHRELGPQVADLARQLGGLGAVEVAADATITLGGCRVETRFGAIDQQFEAQLARIEEEIS